MISSAPVASATTLASLASLENRAWTTKLWVAAVIGVCVGAIIGHTIFRMLGTDATATAFLRIEQPADLIALAGGASQTTPNTQENLQSYAAGEAAYLSGTGFAEAVSEKLGKSEPVDLDVLQDGDTTVVILSSTSTSESDAIRIVATAVDLYRQQLRQRADEQLRTVLPVLDRWELGAAPDRIQDIQGLRNRVQLQAAGASTATVLQTPTVGGETTHRGTIGALLGALLLGSALPLLLMGRRRRAGLVSSDPEVAGAVDGILIPAVDLRRSRDDTVLGRTLWAQLPGTSSPGPRVVVVIGASSLSDTARVVSVFASAAAETGPVTTVELAGCSSESLDLAGCDGTVIVNADAIGNSALLPLTLGMANNLVLVARLGIDTVTQVLAVRAATASADAPLVAVFTHRPWWSRLRAQRVSEAELATADS